MTRINTNLISLQAQSNLYNNESSLQTSLQRLSTGLRINSGKDDPSGLIASSVLGSEVVAVGQAITNSQRANNIVATADAALAQVGTLLNDISGLVQASANKGAISSAEIAANQVQVDSAIESIDRIGATTVFGGDSLLNGSKAFNVAGNLGSVFSSAADISVTSFNPQLHNASSPKSDVTVDVAQTATKGTVNVVGFSGTTGVGLNHLSLGTSTHATTTLAGAAAGGAVANTLNGLTTDGAGAAVTIDVSATGAVTAGQTLTITNSGAGSVGTINLDQSIAATSGTHANALDLAAQINGITKTTGVVATVSGTTVTLKTLEHDGTSTISLGGTATNFNDGATGVTGGGTAVGTADTAGINLTTISLAGSKNASSPVFVTVDNAAVNADSTALVTAINARSGQTGITASLGTDGVGGTGLGASVILTDTATGSTSAVTATALANGATGSNTTHTADANSLNASETNVAGSTGTSNTISLQLTGDLGSAVVTVNNDAILNNVTALVGAINTVTTQTGITATGSGVGGNVTLTSQNYGSAAKVSIQAISATNSADVTLFNSANTQQSTAGKDVSGTVTDGAGSGQFTGTGPQISYSDGSLAFSANTNPTLAAPVATSTTIKGSALSGLTAASNDLESVQLTVTGSLGTTNVNVNVNDLKNDSRALADAINAVSTTTGVQASTTANGAGSYAGQDVVLTATTAGYGGKVQISATGGSGTNTAANQTVFNTTSNYTNNIAGSNAPANTTASFGVTGGALFQIGPQVNFANQVNVNIVALDTNLLGRDSTTTGNLSLHDLHTGGSQVLSSTNLDSAATIIQQAISQIATLRGQLGALQANVLQSNITSQQTALEQVTAAQSSIQDADFAAETANLTRAQVLVQAGTSVLAIANQQPQSVLALLPRG
ncbi:MAG TPA: flagellin [Pirellulales bacterium]|nr:flagellin [Pirellulales bacterium]